MQHALSSIRGIEIFCSLLIHDPCGGGFRDLDIQKMQAASLRSALVCIDPSLAFANLASSLASRKTWTKQLVHQALPPRPVIPLSKISARLQMKQRPKAALVKGAKARTRRRCPVTMATLPCSMNQKLRCLPSFILESSSAGVLQQGLLVYATPQWRYVWGAAEAILST